MGVVILLYNHMLSHQTMRHNLLDDSFDDSKYYKTCKRCNELLRKQNNAIDEELRPSDELITSMYVDQTHIPNSFID